MSRQEITKIMCDRCSKNIDTNAQDLFTLSHRERYITPEGGAYPTPVQRDFCSPECLQKYMRKKYPTEQQIVDKEEDDKLRAEIALTAKEYVKQNGQDPNTVYMGMVQYRKAIKYYPDFSPGKSLMGMMPCMKYLSNMAKESVPLDKHSVDMDAFIEKDYLEVGYTDEGYDFREERNKKEKPKWWGVDFCSDPSTADIIEAYEMVDPNIREYAHLITSINYNAPTNVLTYTLKGGHSKTVKIDPDKWK